VNVPVLFPVPGIVQGVVSDDSDAFLFGSCRVLRNIFADNKYEERSFHVASRFFLA
jgi:5'-3' exonuclease